MLALKQVGKNFKVSTLFLLETTVNKNDIKNWSLRLCTQFELTNDKKEGKLEIQKDSKSVISSTNTVEPRLSGLFDYPDFFLWSQFFHEY